VALSRTQVDRLGDRLRKTAVPSDDDLRLLSEFREERRAVMDAVGSALTEIAGSVPARRLKTINSIVDKLRREKGRLRDTGHHTVPGRQGRPGDTVCCPRSSSRSRICR
jgi:hypothetical protein